MLPDTENGVSVERSQMSLPLSSIMPNPQQPRVDFNEDDLSGLASSIRQKGIIQPLVVRRNGRMFELIAGERRLRAAKLAGIEEVPVRVIKVDSDTEMLELSMIENLQRDDLNPVELAEGYTRLHDKWSLTQEQIAKRVGKDRTSIANLMRILDLPKPVIHSIRIGEISVGHAKAILSAEGAARQSAIWKRVTSENLSVRQTEDLVRGSQAQKRLKRPETALKYSPFIAEYTDRIRRSLGTQVKIKRKGKKGSISIEFYSDQELERLVDLLAGIKE